MKWLFFIPTMFLLTSCYVDTTYLKSEYERLCPEAKQVPFEQVKAMNTCNGMLMQFAIVRMNDPKINQNAEDITGYFADAGIDFNTLQANTGRNALMFAIESKNQEFSKAYLRYSKINTVDPSGNTMLHYLAMTNWWDYKPFLENAQAIANNRNAFGKSAAQIAFENRNYSLVWGLVALGADLNFLAGTSGNLPIEFLFIPQIDLAPKALDDFGGAVLQTFNSYGLIHYAIKNDLSRLFNYLIARKVPLNTSSSEGSPLVMAIKYGRKFMVSTLSEIDEAVQAPGALEFAVGSEYSHIVPQMLTHGAKARSSYELMASDCKDNICQDIGSWASDITQRKDKWNENSFVMQLIYAVYRHQGATQIQWDFAKRLLADQLKAPSDIGFENWAKQNVAHFYFYMAPLEDSGSSAGLFSDQFDLVLSISKKNGLLDKQDIFGMTPLHYWLANRDRSSVKGMGAQSKSTSQLKALLQNTQNVTALNLNNESIVSIAVKTGNKNFVKTVVGHSKDMKKLISLPDAFGNSPLQLAQKLNYREVYEYLKDQI